MPPTPANASPALPAPKRETPPPPTVAALFLGFLGLGLSGFGGVLPQARRVVVEERCWLSAQDFTELLGLCQFLPGANSVNLSVAIGLRFRGIPGALAALTGLVAAPSAIMIGLGAAYDHFSADPHIRHMFAGLAAAAAGLLLSLAAKIGRPFIRDWAALLIAAACIVALAILRLPLLPTLLVLAPLSIVWIGRRRA
jgi:chromate transporter